MIPVLAFTAGGLSDQPRDIRRTANDTYEGFKRFYEYFTSNYQEVEFTTADGQKLMALCQRRGDAAAEADFGWFKVTDITTAKDKKDGLFRVVMSESYFTAANTAGISSGSPAIAAFVREIKVPLKSFEVTDGDKIFLKVTAEQVDIENEYTNEDQEDDPAGGPDGGGTYSVPELITVKVENKCRVWSTTSGEFILSKTAPSNSATVGHILLTEIKIEEGVMTIMMRRRAVDIGTVSAAFGGNPVLDANIEDQLVCIDGESHECSYIAKTNPD